MTVSGFFDESGKFTDHRVICIGCVASFNQHVDEFAHEWGRLLAMNGMKNFHATKAIKHHVPLGTKNPAFGRKERIEALIPFIGCIRKHLAVALGCWVDVKAFNNLPANFFRVYGRDPSFMAFVRTLLKVVEFTPDGDKAVLVCDEDEETVVNFYRLYRRIKKVIPEVKRKFAAISFCDDNYVFAVQAADFVASMVRLDALAKRDKKKNDYLPLFKALTAEPDRKHERIWYAGIGRGDKESLMRIAANTIDDLKRRNLIT